MTDTPEQGWLWESPQAAPQGDRLKVVGIDENGLGPRLGPLAVTGLAVEIDDRDYDREGLWKVFSPLSSGGNVKVGDSKDVAGFQDMAGAETLVHALGRVLGRDDLDTADRLLAWITLTPFEQLCPSPSRRPCFPRDWPLPLFADPDGFDDRVQDLAHRMKTLLAASPIRLVGAVSNIYCPFRYNGYFGHAPEAKKSHLNFSAFEEVIGHFSETFGEEALFLCGKVMNLKYYTRYFGTLSSFEVLDMEETHLLSQYNLDGLGTVRFLHDGDRLDLPISLASILGKYVREIYVYRMNRFFVEAFPSLRPASGYNDKITKQLIERVRPRLDELSIDAQCFLRCK